MTSIKIKKRITKLQRLHETPYDVGERKGQQKERIRILRILRGSMFKFKKYKCNCVKPCYHQTGNLMCVISQLLAVIE